MTSVGYSTRKRALYTLNAALHTETYRFCQRKLYAIVIVETLTSTTSFMVTIRHLISFVSFGCLCGARRFSARQLATHRAPAAPYHGTN